MIAAVGLLTALCVVTPETLELRAAADLGVDGRPILSGPGLFVDSSDGSFRIHYTLEGGDALGDLEIIDATIEALQRTRDAFVVEDGWPAPRNDGTLGGDGRLDLYLRGLDINGYAHAQDYGETRVCWMEVDPGTRSLGRETYASIVGHEFHHCLQFTVADTRVGGSFPYEGTSTYAQYLLFQGDPAVDLARQVLWQLRLVDAARPLDAVGDRFEYAGMIWFKFLLDHGGRVGVTAGSDRRKLLALWEAMAAESSWSLGHDAVLPSLFGLPDLDTAAARFAEWNLFACNRDDGRHYAPGSLACGLEFVAPAVRVAAYPAMGTSPPVGRWGSTYVDLYPDCSSSTLTVTARATGAMRAQLVEIGASEASPVSEQAIPAGGEVTFSLPDWNRRKRVVLIGTSVDGGNNTLTWSAATSGSYVDPASTPPIARLRLDTPDRVVLAPGQTRQVKALAQYDTCQDGRDVSAQVLWHSSDDSIASVADGVVTAHANGFTEIWATVGEVGSIRVAIDVDGGLPGGCAVAPRGEGAWMLLLIALLMLRRR
jgi:hypothetical protein